MSIPRNSIRLARKIEEATGIKRILDPGMCGLAAKRARESSRVPGHRYLDELQGQLSWGEVLGYNRFAQYPIALVVYGNQNLVGWMDSPTHREVLMREDLTYIGTGIYRWWLSDRWWFCAIVTDGPFPTGVK